MRDVHRLREKVELSLDDRQVAVLAVCALLLLGGVFTLGVMVGKRLAAAAPQAMAADDLAALDEQQSQRRSAADTRPAAAPPAVVTPAVSPSPVTAAAAAPAHPASAHPTAAAPPVAPPPVEVAQKDDLDDQPAPDQGKPAAPPGPAVMPSPRPTLVVDPPPAAAKVRPATQAVINGAPRDVGQFTVQVGASQDRADAQRLEARARSAGLKAYIVEARIGAATWYRVRVGAFNDKDSATRYRRDVERELRTSAMVMPAH